MIKVNLVKALKIEAAEPSSFSGSGETLKNFDTPIKIILMCFFVLIIYVYEFYEIDKKKKILSVLRVQREQIQDEVSKNKEITVAVKELTEEKKNILDQIKTIQKISQKRAFKMKIITAIQENIPPDVWLQEIKVKKGKLDLFGFAINSSAIQKIAKKLGDLPFTKKVQNKDFKREKMGKKEVYFFHLEGIFQV